MLCAGIDEAGRGCLAGPVVAAAVILPPVYELPYLADSKTLSAKRRSLLEGRIKEAAIARGIGVIWPEQIDRQNILQASLMAMASAVGKLRVPPELLLVDGNQTIPAPYLAKALKQSIVPPGQKAIVRGDSLVPAISAASILAKTFRDRIMQRMDRRFPGYGFARHKGYGTKEHLEALRALGPTQMHRKTFRGVLPPCEPLGLWRDSHAR